MAPNASTARRSVRNQQDFLGSIFLLAICALAFWQAMELPVGSLNAMGPGMMPAVLAVLLAALAVVLLIDSFKVAGPDVPAPSWRGIIFVLGAFVAFGLAIRTLGLSVAGPLAVILSGFASPETRFTETALFALGMTAFCAALFKFALGLPIPLAPWLLGY